MTQQYSPQWQQPSSDGPKEPPSWQEQLSPPLPQQPFQGPPYQPPYQPPMQPQWQQSSQNEQLPPYPYNYPQPPQQQVFQQQPAPSYPAPGLYPQQAQPSPYQQQPYPSPYQQPYPPQGVQINNYMQPPMMAMPTNVVQVNIQQHKTSFFVRVLYFIFIGSWLGFFWLNLGYSLCLFIFTLPLGLAMLNRLPYVLTLRPADQHVNVTTTSNMAGTTTTINVGGSQQYSFLVRALYFIFIGSWAGYLWALIGYACCLTIFLLPVGLIMLNRLPAVITLRKN